MRASDHRRSRQHSLPARSLPLLLLFATGSALLCMYAFATWRSVGGQSPEPARRLGVRVAFWRRQSPNRSAGFRPVRGSRPGSGTRESGLLGRDTLAAK